MGEGEADGGDEVAVEEMLAAHEDETKGRVHLQGANKEAEGRKKKRIKSKRTKNIFFCLKNHYISLLLPKSLRIKELERRR